MKLVVRIDSPAGAINAAPTPCASRAPTSMPALVAQPAGQRGDREQGRCRPRAGGGAEQVGGAAAEQQEAAVGEEVGAEHPLQALLGEAQSSRIEGSATFTIDESTMSMNWTAKSSGSVSLPRRGGEEGPFSGVRSHFVRPPGLADSL